MINWGYHSVDWMVDRLIRIYIHFTKTMFWLLAVFKWWISPISSNNKELNKIFSCKNLYKCWKFFCCSFKIWQKSFYYSLILFYIVQCSYIDFCLNTARTESEFGLWICLFVLPLLWIKKTNLDIFHYNSSFPPFVMNREPWLTILKQVKQLRLVWNLTDYTGLF